MYYECGRLIKDSIRVGCSWRKGKGLCGKTYDLRGTVEWEKEEVEILAKAKTSAKVADEK